MSVPRNSVPETDALARRRGLRKLGEYSTGERVFAVALTLIGSVFGWLLDFTSDRRLDFTFALVCALTVFLGLVVGALVYAYKVASRSEKALSLQARECERLERLLNELARKIGAAPLHFEPLSSTIRDFAAQLLSFGRLVIEGLSESLAKNNKRPQRISREQLDRARQKVWEAHLDVLQSICNTAAAVIDSYRSPSATGSSASLTTIPRFIIEPLCRSFPHRAERRQDDRRLADARIPVDAHRIYSLIMERIDEMDAEARIPDMDEFLGQMKRGSKFAEPRNDAGKLYQSALVVPITDLDQHRKVLGFLSIDNHEKHAFNHSYELSILRELSHYAAIAIGSMLAVDRAVSVVNGLGPPAKR